MSKSLWAKQVLFLETLTHRVAVTCFQLQGPLQSMGGNRIHVGKRFSMRIDGTT